MALSINSYQNRNANNYRSNNGTEDNNKTTTSDVSKGTGTGMGQNPLAGSKYMIKTNTSPTTVLNIMKEGSEKPIWVTRIDAPHKRANAMYNHINTNTSLYKGNKIYQSINHKPVSNATYSIAKNFDDVAKYTKVGGRALSIFAVASDSIDIYDSYKADGNKVGKNTAITSAGVAGSWLGSIGGAKAGAAGGAAIGTAICPGLGTPIGGGIGGIFGGIVGAILGREGGEAIAKNMFK